jgi:hypothetical protein
LKLQVYKRKGRSVMLSNLVVKSNIIENCADEALERLSAIDLHSVSVRNPLIGRFFDERSRHLGFRIPTKIQNEQWTARLFWGDKTVSLEDADRGNAWIRNKADEIVPLWKQLKGNIDIEYAKEWLWFCSKVKYYDKWKPKCDRIQTEIREYLKSREQFSDDAIDQLISNLEGKLGG